MSEEIRSILVGLILGDGYLTKFYGLSRKSRLDVKGDDKCLEYLRWLHRKLRPLGVSDLKSKKNYHQHRFYTRATKEIGELREIFYPNGEKVIPEDIADYLKDPLTLAVWYQDDGTLDCRSKYHYNALFATHCFSLRECRLLAKALGENFSLDVRVCRCKMRGKIRYRLYITSKSMTRFISLVKPFIAPCFNYKVRKLSSQQQR